MNVLALPVVIFIFSWSEGSTLSCYNCTGVTSPSRCFDVIQCQDDEVCMTRKYTEPGRDTIYDLGCSADTEHKCHPMSRSVRSSSGHYQIEFWSSCCHGNLCNDHFDDKGSLKDIQQLACSQCAGISDPSKCNMTTLCNHGEFCSIHEDTDLNTGERMYYMGCLSKKTCDAVRLQQTKRRTMCRGCCDEPKCNSKMCTVTSETTTVVPVVDPFRNTLLVATPEQQNAEYKSPTRIGCQLRGATDAIPTLVWYHAMPDGTLKDMMKHSGNQLIMVIPEVDRATSGKYVCKAYLGGREAAVKATVNLADFITITTPPYSVSVKEGVTVNQHSVTIKAGSDFKLPCEADGIPKPYISWTIEKIRQPTMTVGAGGPRYSAPLPFLNMQAKYQGLYTCTASNSHGTAEETVMVRMDS